jgi:3-phosphoshikimate 1-carboxyvinyltransferase
LVEALKILGTDIQYLENDGFAPLRICGKNLNGGQVTIDPGESSQFISALLLIAPCLNGTLKLNLSGEVVSEPYITMTIALLHEFGVHTEKKGNYLLVSHPRYTYNQANWVIESDWSSASYWYGIAALANEANIEINGLQQKSLQADSVLPGIYDQLGVHTQFQNNGIHLSRKKTAVTDLNLDCKNFPDIAQTLIVSCFALGISANLKGLQTLKIKETDRLLAMKTELEKLGATIALTDSSIHLVPPETLDNSPSAVIQTYNDHRMALSFAALSLRFEEITIDQPSVISKSYPEFWQDLKSSGFDLK